MYCLSGANLKVQKTPLPNQLKKKNFFFQVSHVCAYQPFPQIKISAILNLQIKIILGTTTTPPPLFLEALVSRLHILDNFLKKKMIQISMLVAA